MKAARPLSAVDRAAVLALVTAAHRWKAWAPQLPMELRSPPGQSPSPAFGARLESPMEYGRPQPCPHSRRFDLGIGMT
jgi:hypothetical protein